MIRPVDGTGSVPEDPLITEAPAPDPEPVVARRPAQPLYLCATPEGSEYQSDDNSGNPRWVPYYWGGGADPRTWEAPETTAQGMPGRVSRVGTGGMAGVSVPGPSGVSAPIPGRTPQPSPSAPIPPRPPSDGDNTFASGGTWVRDTCRQLSVEDACERLSGQREGIRKRAFQAQQVEKDRLRDEEGLISARLANDCPGA